MKVSGQLYTLATLPPGRVPSTHWAPEPVLMRRRPFRESNRRRPASSPVSILSYPALK